MALVLALTVFAASPKLHDLLHDEDGCNDGSTCAVVLFAHGVSVPVALQAERPMIAAWHETIHETPERIFLAPPRYLRQPERGPPVNCFS
jgi:hypothetical protein